MIKLLFWLTFIGVLTINCKSNHSEFIIAEYFRNADSIIKGENNHQYLFKEKGNNYLATFKYYSKGELLSIKGLFLDKNYGCSFFFFSNKRLSDFMFNVGDDKYNQYNIIYKHGSYIEEGVPLVDFWPKECPERDDSILCFEVHISYFPRKNITAKFSLDGIRYQSLKLEKSKLLPFILSGELKMPMKKDKSVFFIIDADNLIINLPGLESEKIFNDTLIVS